MRMIYEHSNHYNIGLLPNVDSPWTLPILLRLEIIDRNNKLRVVEWGINEQVYLDGVDELVSKTIPQQLQAVRDKVYEITLITPETTPTGNTGNSTEVKCQITFKDVIRVVIPHPVTGYCTIKGMGTYV